MAKSKVPTPAELEQAALNVAANLTVEHNTNVKDQDMSETQETQTTAAKLDMPTFVQELKERDANKNVVRKLDLELTDKWIKDMVVTDHAAAMLNDLIARQFVNNQEANALARNKRRAAATTDEERNAENNRELSEADYVKLWNAYDGPAIQGTPRQSAMQRMQIQAALVAFSIMEKEHNEAMDRGEAPTLFRNATKRNTVFVAKKDAEGNTVTAAEQREALAKQLLTIDAYAPRIAAQLELIVAQSDAKKATPNAPAATVDSVLSDLAA
jgi:hypothetical protein